MTQNSRFPTRVYEYIIIVILLYTYPALLDACLRRCHASDPLDRLMCRMLGIFKPTARCCTQENSPTWIYGSAGESQKIDVVEQKGNHVLLLQGGRV